MTSPRAARPTPPGSARSADKTICTKNSASPTSAAISMVTSMSDCPPEANGWNSGTRSIEVAVSMLRHSHRNAAPAASATAFARQSSGEDTHDAPW